MTRRNRYCVASWLPVQIPVLRLTWLINLGFGQAAICLSDPVTLPKSGLIGLPSLALSLFQDYLLIAVWPFQECSRI